MSRPARIRCAVYTRKSSEEGLDQDFNSLAAQREACQAYIASQRHEGWQLAKGDYDDGGVSGGTLARPGLAALLGDIEAGRIDMVVVYKIDRLTRSLTDFARLVERLDAAGCSFVSVTQAFNTSTSMGRLTLNVLLSFAQFEREVTAERIRDKIAASKKKGLWMGGLAPLGYDAPPSGAVRKLVVNASEASQVRTLFELYLRHECLGAVQAEAERRAIRSKLRHFASGRVSGGSQLSRGQIHHILTNPVYRGRIRHKQESYHGLHEAIIDEETWARVQACLQARSRRARVRDRASGSLRPPAHPSPLAGKLFDETGERMGPTHARSGARRKRYYVSARLLKGTRDPSGWRVPAGMIEELVASAIAARLKDQPERWVGQAQMTTIDMVCRQAPVISARLESGQSDLMAELVARADLAPGRLQITLDPDGLASALQVRPDQLDPGQLTFETQADLRRRGVELKLVSGPPAREPDHAILRAIARAHAWQGEILDGTEIRAIAAREACTSGYVRKLLVLSGLAPHIIETLLAGRHPPELTLNRLLDIGVDPDWSEQARALGFQIPCSG